MRTRPTAPAGPAYMYECYARVHTGFLSVAKVPRFQNHRPRAIPHRHSSWVHEYDLHAYGIPVQMIPGLWNEIIGD